MLDHWSNYLSIIWNFYFGCTGVFFNIILVYFVFKHTPDYMRTYATLLRVGAIGDTIASFSAMMTSTRAFSTGVSMILMFNGAIKYLPVQRTTLPYVAFFFFAFEIHGYLFSLFIILFSLYYRLRTVTHYHKNITQWQVNLACYPFSILVLIFATMVATNVPPFSAVNNIVRRVRPELINSNWVYFALLDVSDGITEALVIVLNWSALIFGLYCRWRINKKLISLPMSSALKEMHRSLMTILLFQIVASCTQVGALLCHFLSIVRNDLQTELIENLVELQIVFLPSVTPFLTFFFVKPYRIAIERMFCTSRTLPSSQVSVFLVESIHQV